MQDEVDFRNVMYDLLENFLQSSMSIFVFSLYLWLGNTLTLSKMVLTEMMIS